MDGWVAYHSMANKRSSGRPAETLSPNRIPPSLPGVTLDKGLDCPYTAPNFIHQKL